MKVAIVFDSSTGKTKAAAEQMGEAARAAGHECTVDSIHDADPAQVANMGGADAIDNARSRAGLGTTIVLENQIRGRTQDRVFHTLEGSGGAVTRATRSTRPSLATNPYGA